MKWVRRISVIIGLLFATLSLIFIVVTINPALVKPIVNNLVSANLNRPFDIKGNITLSVYPKLIIDIENIHLANPEWSTSPEMASVEQVQITINPKEFFFENMKISEFHAQGISLFLEKNAVDEANWQFTSDTLTNKKQVSLSLFASQIIVQDFTFQYKDESDQVITGYIRDFDASLTKQAGLMATLNGTLQDRALELSIVSDKEVAVDQAFPITGTFDLAGETQVNLEGDLGWPLRSADTTIRFSMEGNNLQKLGKLLSISALSLPEPYYLNAIINANEHVVSLKNIDSSVGISTLTGDLALTIAKQAKLTSDIQLSINEQYKDLHIKLEMNTDLQALQAGEALPLDGKVNLNEIVELDLKGTFAWPLSKTTTDLDLVLKGKDLSRVAQLLAIEKLSYSEPFYLKTAINASDQRITLSSIDSSVGKIRLAGDLALTIAKQAKLTSDIQLSINEQYEDLHIKLEMNTDLQALQAGEAIPLDAKVSLNNITELDLRGTFSWPLSRTTADMNLVLKGEDLSKVGQLLAIEQLASPDSYYIKSVINTDKRGIALSQIDASIGKYKLAGNLELVVAEKAKLSGDLKLTIDDQYKNLSIKLALTTDKNVLEMQSAMPVEGKLSLSNVANIDFNGELGWPLHTEYKTKLKVAMKGKSLKNLGNRFVIPQLAKSVPYQLAGLIEADSKFISLKNISSEIGELIWTGNLSWQQQAPKKLSGALNVKYVDDEILTYFQPTTQLELNRGYQKPDFDTDIELTIEKLNIQQVHLSNIIQQTKIRAGKVHIVSKQEGDFFTKLHLDLKMDLNKKPWAYQLQGKANKVSVAKPLSMLTEKEGISGEIENLDWGLSGVFIDNKPLSLPKGVINIKDINLAVKLDDDSIFPLMMDSAQLSLEDNEEIIIKLVAKESDDYKLPLDLSVTTNEKILTFLTSGEPLPVTVEFSANKAHLFADGFVKYDGEKDDWDYQMKVNLKGPNIKKTVSLFEEEFDLEEKYKLTTTIKGTNSKVQLFDTDILVGNSTVKGELLAEKTSKRWLVTAKLVSDHIDLNDVLPTLVEVDDKHEKATDDKGLFLSNKPFNTNLLTYFDMDFNIDFNNITNDEILLGDYNAVATLIDGVLRAKVAVDGGYQRRKSNYDFELKAIDNMLDLILLVNINNFYLRNLLTLTDLTDGVEGKLNVDVEFQGRGESVSQMISQGTGVLYLDAGEGRLSSRLLNLWGTGLASSLLFSATSNQNIETKINCAAAKFVLANGVIESQGIVIDTAETTMAGQIQIKLPEETLRGVVKPEPKRTSVVSIKTPVSLSGTVLKPKIAVASDDALLTPLNMVVDFYITPFTLVKNVVSSNAKNPCEEALSETGRAEKKGIVDVITSPIKSFFGIFKSKGAKEEQ